MEMAVVMSANALPVKRDETAVRPAMMNVATSDSPDAVVNSAVNFACMVLLLACNFCAFGRSLDCGFCRSFHCLDGSFDCDFRLDFFHVIYYYLLMCRVPFSYQRGWLKSRGLQSLCRGGIGPARNM